MKGRFENIQALRGVAALMVFLAHIKGAEGDYGAGGDLMPYALNMGVTGVDLFFLISGYVMVHVTADLGRGQFLQFIYKRAARIYPLYWALTAGLLILYAGKKALFAEDTPIANLLASLLLIPDRHFPILQVGWTLVHEIYFYLAFAVILLLRSSFLPWLLLGWAAAVMMAAAMGAGGWGAGPKIWFNPLTLEFITGCFIAIIVRRGITRFATAALIAGALWLTVIFIAGAGSLYPDVIGIFSSRVMIFTPPFALLLYGAVSMEINRGHVAPAWLIKTGDASYALYLVHVPVFLVVGKSLSGLTGPGSVDNIFLIAAYAIAGLAAAFAAHAYLEKPMLAATKKLGARLFSEQTSRTSIRQDRAW